MVIRRTVVGTFVFIVLLLSLAGVPAGEAASKPGPDFELTFHNNLISLDATNVRLADVLAAIARKGQIDIRTVSEES